MSSALYMTTKSFFKRVWPWAMLGVCLLVLIPLAINKGYWFWPLSITQGDDHPLTYHFWFWGGFGLSFVLICGFGGQGASRVILGLPMSSTRLASGIMLSTVGAFVLLSLITNGLYRIVFDKNWLNEYWPVWGPTLFIATLIMVVWCAYWNLQAIGFGKLLFWISFILAMVGWFISRYFPHGFGEELVPWNNVTLTELITLLVVFVSAWGWGIQSFARIRCGAAAPSRQWSYVESWLNGLSHKKQKQNSSISKSKIQTFARLNWDESGPSVILSTVLLGCLTLAINLVGYLQNQTSGASRPLIDDNPAEVTVLILLFSLFTIVLIMGLSLTLQDQKGMKGYLAATPVSDQELAMALIRNLFKCMGLTLIFIVLIGFGGSYLFTVFYQGTEVLRNSWGWLVNHESKELFITIPVLFLLGYWVVLANSVSVMWTGRAHFINFMMLFGSGLICLTMTVLLESFQIFQRTGIQQGLSLCLTSLICIGTIIAFVKAYHFRLIRNRTVWMAILFCLIVPPLFWGVWKTDQYIVRLFQSVLLILAVTPFATIPLAVFWNRHR